MSKPSLHHKFKGGRPINKNGGLYGGNTFIDPGTPFHTKTHFLHNNEETLVNTIKTFLKIKFMYITTIFLELFHHTMNHLISKHNPIHNFTFTNNCTLSVTNDHNDD